MAFAMHMQPSASTPFTSPNHQATPTGQGHQQQQQLFFTPQQPRTSNPFHFPGQDPFSFSSLQSDSTPKPVETGGLGAGAGGQRQKGHRHSTGSYSRGSGFKPLNSSPLARSSKLDEDEDDMDDDFSSHQPSSPLGRVSFLPPPTSSSTTTAPGSTSAFTMGLARSTRRRPKTLGRDSDDDDDELNPSPLVQRRRAQYKSTGPSTLPRANTFTPARRFSSTRPSASAMSSMSWDSSPSSSPPVAALFERPRNIDGDEDPRRAFLRERFKKRYFARATKAREKAVKARRRRVEGTEDYFANEDDESDDGGIGGTRKSKGKGKAISDDEDMDDEDEGEEEILNDELFSRIVANMNRKMQHAYRVSYAHEIGSSFDPDIEDVSRWEEELQAEPRTLPASSSSATSLPSSSSHTFPPSSSGTFLTPSSSGSRSGTVRADIGSSPPRAPSDYEYDGNDEDEFADLEDAEIEAYAEEYARAIEAHEQEQQQNNSGNMLSQNNASSGSGQSGQEDLFAGLEDIPEDELFGEWNWSESEAEGPSIGAKVDEDGDMDWS